MLYDIRVADYCTEAHGLCKVQFHAFADNAGHIKLWAFVDLDPDEEVCIAKP